MVKVRLIRVHSNHNNLRTNEVIGLTPKLPHEGESFVIWSDALETDGGYRQVITTPVEEIVFDAASQIIFNTKNSQYRVEVLEEAQDKEVPHA
jgi:hypothetical protein